MSSNGACYCGTVQVLTGRTPHQYAADPTESIVIKHLPNHRVELTLNGELVSGLNADGTKTNAERTITVTKWRGVPMAEGNNVLVARVIDANGSTVETLERRLRYSIDVQRAVLVPDESVLVADGVNRLRSPERSMIVITHYQRLLDYIVPDYVHVMVEGRIVRSGGKELALELEEKGYDWIRRETADVVAAG